MVTIPAYTWGTDQPAAPGAPLGGGAYYSRRKRFLAYITTCLVVLVLA